MTSRNRLLLTLASLLVLTACDSSKTRTQNIAKIPAPVSTIDAPTQLITAANGAVVEKQGPITWNTGASRFEFGGQPLTVGRLWNFAEGPQDFVPRGALSGPVEGSGLAVTEAGGDAAMRSIAGLNLEGGKHPLVIVRLTRIRAGDLWDGSLFYTTASHGESEQFKGKAPKEANPALNETVTLVYDMAKLRRGGDDWLKSTIDQIRFDLDDAPGGAFIIHQIAFAARPAGYP